MGGSPGCEPGLLTARRGQVRLRVFWVPFVRLRVHISTVPGRGTKSSSSTTRPKSPKQIRTRPLAISISGMARQSCWKMQVEHLKRSGVTGWTKQNSYGQARWSPCAPTSAAIQGYVVLLRAHQGWPRYKHTSGQGRGDWGSWSSHPTSNDDGTVGI